MFKKLGKLISYGVYGAVYENKDNKEKYHPLTDGTNTEGLLKIYQKIQKLNYKYFIKIYDVKFDGYFCFVEMEKVDKTLDQLSTKERVKILPQVKKILDDMEKDNICHNDFHMANIGLIKDKIKLIDVDFAKYNQKEFCYDRMKFWTNYIMLLVRGQKLDLPKQKLQKEAIRYNKINSIIYNKLKFPFQFWKYQTYNFVFYKQLLQLTDQQYINLYNPKITNEQYYQFAQKIIKSLKL